MPVLKFSMERTVFFSKGTDVPPDVTSTRGRFLSRKPCANSRMLGPGRRSQSTDVPASIQSNTAKENGTHRCVASSTAFDVLAATLSAVKKAAASIVDSSEAADETAWCSLTRVHVPALGTSTGIGYLGEMEIACQSDGRNEGQCGWGGRSA